MGGGGDWDPTYNFWCESKSAKILNSLYGGGRGGPGNHFQL